MKGVGVMEIALTAERRLEKGQDVICPVILDYEYKVLDPDDEKVMIDTAECLAETFAGTYIDGVRVSEPMVNACNLSKEAMFEFTMGYLKNVADQGLCYVALDRETGRVVGALACEDFNPDEEPPVFEGDLEPMNIIIPFLTDLDERLVNTIHAKTGKRPTRNEYIHTFMAGVRLGKLKRFVVIRMFDMLIKEGRKRGYKGMFGEATNFKSMKMMTEYSGFHPVYDLSGKPILSLYSEHEVFKSIPPEISTDCRILYRPLFPEYDI
ncbi:hypothetical protein [Clostridium thermosuccinogenes]|nr:hypothetical protein [Pseudoclostridium thermosuccinogenes]